MKKIVCPKCDGEGKCIHYKFVGYTHVWATFQEIPGECPTCKGKGYLEETR